VNKYLARLKAQSPQKCPGRALSKSSKSNLGLHGGGQLSSAVYFDDFECASPGHVLPETGIPHPRYGHDEFSLIRLPHPAITKYLSG